MVTEARLSRKELIKCTLKKKSICQHPLVECSLTPCMQATHMPFALGEKAEEETGDEGRAMGGLRSCQPTGFELPPKSGFVTRSHKRGLKSGFSLVDVTCISIVR